VRHKGIKRDSRVIIEEGCFCPAVVAWHYFHAGAPGVICPATFRCAHFFLWRRSPKEWKKERRPHASIGGVYTHRYTGNNWWMADIRVICLQSWTACCVEWTRNKREEKGGGSIVFSWLLLTETAAAHDPLCVCWCQAAGVKRVRWDARPAPPNSLCIYSHSRGNNRCNENQKS
jgi:hypothetical protein